MKTPETITRALAQAQRALICMHVSPDGDTLGASLALAEALRALGKQVQVTCTDDIPAMYRFLPGAQDVRRPQALAGQAFDLAVAVDVSDHHRLEAVGEPFDAATVRVVIDHHPTNDRFGQLNWIEPTASATGVMALRCIQALGVALTPTMGECLYAAIATDTGNFSYPNTNAAALHAAAELVDAGVRVDRLTERIYRTRSCASVRLLARTLMSLRFFAEERIALLSVTAQDFAETGADESMAEGIVNYALEIEGVQMAALAKENGSGIKFSLRAKAPRDVAQVAIAFGGGGHTQAAGCLLPLPQAEAEERMVCALEAALLG
jgi:phosphoesterase RecJ-like protein